MIYVIDLVIYLRHLGRAVQMRKYSRNIRGT